MTAKTTIEQLVKYMKFIYEQAVIAGNPNETPAAREYALSGIEITAREVHEEFAEKLALIKAKIRKEMEAEAAKR